MLHAAIMHSNRRHKLALPVASDTAYTPEYAALSKSAHLVLIGKEYSTYRESASHNFGTCSTGDGTQQRLCAVLQLRPELHQLLPVAGAVG